MLRGDRWILQERFEANVRHNFRLLLLKKRGDELILDCRCRADICFSGLALDVGVTWLILLSIEYPHDNRIEIAPFHLLLFGPSVGTFEFLKLFLVEGSLLQIFELTIFLD